MDTYEWNITTCTVVPVLISMYYNGEMCILCESSHAARECDLTCFIGAFRGSVTNTCVTIKRKSFVQYKSILKRL